MTNEKIEYSTRKECKTGRYRGIFFEALNWGNEEHKIWNAYIYIDENFLKETIKEKISKIEQMHYGWDFDSIEEIANVCKSMHGGCTYQRRRDDGRHKLIVLGWDYSHLGDNFFDYDFESILNDIKNVIDKCQFLKKGE